MGAFEERLLHLQHITATNVHGGKPSAADSFQTRTINTVITNEISGASLSSNQITLPAGTYIIKSSCVVYLTREYATILYDTTGTATLLEGTSDYSTEASSQAGATATSHINGKFTLGVTSVLEIRHGQSNALDTNNPGRNFGIQVNLVGVDQNTYADVRIWKVN